MGSWKSIVKSVPAPARSVLRRYRNKFLRAVRWAGAHMGPDLLFFRRVASIYDAEQRDVISGYRCVSGAADLAFQERRYRDYLGRSVFYPDAVYRRSEAFVCVVENAKFGVDSGVIATAENVLLAESAMERGRLMALSAYGARIPKIERSFDQLTSIWHGWGNNYYHWLIDCLPRIYSLNVALAGEAMDLVMPDDARLFHRQFLEWCLPPSIRVQYLPRRAWVQARQWVFPSFVTSKACGYIPEAHCRYLRERIFQATNMPDNHHYRNRIYISRRKARVRRVLNEAEVIQLLSRHGFRVFTLEDMTLEEQVALFHSAEIVVAPHGAGLSNILFSGNIKVVDLIPCPVPETHFYFLSQCLGQQYFYMLSDQRSKDRDFSVDIVGLERCLREAIEA